MKKIGKKAHPIEKTFHFSSSSGRVRLVADGKMYVSFTKNSSMKKWQLMTKIEGYFSLTVAGIFLVILAMLSEYINNCTNMPPEEALATCKLSPDNHTTASNLMTILAVLNSLQFGCSLGIIWRATKKETKYVTTWIIFSLIWTYIYSIMALLYVVAIADTIYVFNLSALAIFFLVINILGLFIVLRFCQDMLNSQYHKRKVLPKFSSTSFNNMLPV